ncbi:MAG TPA: peptide-N-glycosidase F-related protein [Candidatus Polarisedimenticolaceae bacterium]|nr:peptide-N-glycosidase F-related protein [Candidatus Polarisedimenticolaceae bacterium]
MRLAALVLLGSATSFAFAADVTPPASVTGLLAARSGADVQLQWDPVSLDATGGAETITAYRIYRGTSAGFVPDKTLGSNRVGTSSSPSFLDGNAIASGLDGYYLVSAVDAAGNESATRPATAVSAATLSGTYTDTGVDLNWTAAAPADQVAKYLVYYGTAPHRYDAVKDVGPATSTSMTGLSANVNYYFAVVAVDPAGNAGPYSNEHVDCVAGRIALKAHDDDGLCWLSGGQSCPVRAGAVQRDDGFQLMVPVDFPEGAWTKITMTLTMDSRLCKVGANGTTDKCGSTNPTPGGWNPCGDPWDRIAQTFLVLDNCLAGTGSCITNDNLELIHAVTPFGTDAPAPNGTGVVPPRVVTMDVTPYAPLLSGHRFIGAEIANFATAGWHVTTQFQFTKRPEEASPKHPAAGIEVVGFGGAPLPSRSVSIPLGATQVKGRLFTTGHGGTQYCDGGSNDGAACTANSNCPGGSCQNCDEFCHRTNRILKNGAPVYTVVPFRTDCSVPVTACQSWNACGFPSCAFSRAGWCPGYLACTSNAPGCDQDIDLTSQFPPGGTYNVSYDVLVQRGSWSVSLVLYWY